MQLILAVLVIVSSTIIVLPEHALAKELYFIDAHSQMDRVVSESNILRLMNENGVNRTILASRSGRKPKEILQFSSEYHEQIIPSMPTKQFGYVSDSKEKHKKLIQVMQKMSNSGQFRAMAEVLMWHSGCPNNKCPSVEVYSNDIRVKKALEIAVDNGWPFIAHIEFGSLSESKRNKYWSGLESMLNQYPDHPFALIHMGQLDVDDVRKLIANYKNIHFLTAHTNTLAVKSAGGFKPWIDMFEGNSFKSNWQQLLVDHPDRFIFAMDNVWGQTHWQAGLYSGQIKLWRKALKDLPEEAAHAIAHGNAERLWNIPAFH